MYDSHKAGGCSRYSSIVYSNRINATGLVFHSEDIHTCQTWNCSQLWAYSVGKSTKRAPRYARIYWGKIRWIRYILFLLVSCTENSNYQSWHMTSSSGRVGPKNACLNAASLCRRHRRRRGRNRRDFIRQLCNIDDAQAGNFLEKSWHQSHRSGSAA